MTATGREPAPDLPEPAGAATDDPFAPRVALAPGDRVPDFVLPDQSGAFRHFTERARGLPILLLLLPDEAARAQDASAAIVAGASGITQLGADVIAIRLGETGLPANADGGGATWLADPKGKILEAFRKATGLPADRTTALLLDANQRVVGASAGPDPLGWAARTLAAEPAPEAARTLGSVAPVLIVPNVLDRAACRALIERWERDHEEGSVTSLVDGAEVQRVYHAMKRRRDHAIQDEALLKSLIQTIGRRLAPELDRAFGFRRFRFDRFIVTCYDAERGDYFRRHRDNASPGTADRRYALTLNLNTEDYEGGDLLFPEFGGHRYRPATGGAILFACGLLHEALPVSRGRRFTLLSFLRDPAQPAPARG